MPHEMKVLLPKRQAVDSTHELNECIKIMQPL